MVVQNDNIPVISHPGKITRRRQIKRLDGQRFGRLVVTDTVRRNNTTYVTCQCDCGAICEVAAGDIQKKKKGTRSCGCLRKDIVPRYTTLLNQKFGKLTVTHLYKIDGKGKTRVECQCDCGNRWHGSPEHLLDDHTNSCGCIKHIEKRHDHTGERYGKLVVLSTTWDSPNGKARIKAQCDCGNLWEGKPSGRIKSCGCREAARRVTALAIRQRKQREQAQWKASHPAEVRQHGILAHARRRARTKGLPDNLTKQSISFAYQYWHFACAICGKENGLWYTIALDHWIPIASKKTPCPGSVPTNILPLCHTTKNTQRDISPSCNQTKHAKDPILWLTTKLGPRRAKAKLREIETYFVAARAFNEQQHSRKEEAS